MRSVCRNFKIVNGAKAGSSWGEKENVKDYDNAGNWFSNGVTAINSVSVMTGNEKLQTYFSYANTTAKGIVDSNKLRKHNLTLRESASLFNDRLKLDANANLMVQTIKNSPTSGVSTSIRWWTFMVSRADRT